VIKRLSRLLVPDLPHFRWRALTEFNRFRTELPQLGWSAALQLGSERCFAQGQTGRVRSVRLPGFRFPLYYRPGTSDPDVIHQVFVRREYECAAALPGIEYVVDCGANIGTSAFYLLHRYPTARVVVAEPDPGNMAMCQRNLAPFRDRVTYIQAGVWSAAGQLMVERGCFGDGAEWSFQVRPARPDEVADVAAVTIADLMAAGGYPRIDLLKVDIEAAEAEVFGSGVPSWLKHTRNLVIELHGPKCEKAVATALANFQSQVAVFGELTLFRDMTSVDCRPCS
jgi:FkbM family methyltransferase